MTDGQPRRGSVRESPDAGGPPSRDRPVRVGVLVALGVLLVALAVGPGGVAAAGHAATGLGAADAAVDDGVPPTAEQSGSPLAGANGTVELVVRFDPVDDPAALGATDGVPAAGANAGATVADLRDHAAAERSAFESFAADRPGVSVEREFWLANAALVTVDADRVTAADLRAVENVTRIHENVVVEPIGSTGTQQIEADPDGRATSGLRQIGAPTAWRRFGTRGSGATVAVVDTGVSRSHRDIDLAGWASFDGNGTLVSDDASEAFDPDGHGTHVAGTVAGGNASGTHIGVAPEAALYGIDAFDENGTATFAAVLAAMEHATTTADADVLQLSLGANGTFRGFVGPVRNARATGTVVVAAVGNEGENTSSSPANVYDAVAVGAVDAEGTVPPFSGGQRVDAAAFGSPPDDWPESYVVPDVTGPGVRVASAAAGTRNGYVFRQGTSMAAPHVSGVAALAVAATDGRVAAPTIEAALVDTAVHPTNATDPDTRYGHGVVDAPAAVGAAVEATPPAEPTDVNGTTGGNGTTDRNENGPGTGDGGTDGRAPGFGAVAALAAVVAVALASRSRVGRGRD
ncbi:S8 family serine peptidase [Halorubrum tebenquichense]|uniref:Peptidase S8/S53 subtilisin kexin sedolisin n=1 Tax=Halorubrum tebenquichense DSM 14210 TaxID=1227485 RepID=M0E3V3_9EURY|nr:S8 family serine peptidase [Halorubrum tebenquichense]ELZ41622.1 peptidase S8/S53 subtilisin kexin sedolisin [Halorubrum tebenquichense DSM 14210]